MKKDAPGWLNQRKDGVTLTVKVKPGGKKHEITGVEGDTLKLEVKAPPVDGAANDAVVDFFAHQLGVAKARVRIIMGLTNSRKVVLIEGGNASAVLAGLNVPAGGATP